MRRTISAFAAVALTISGCGGGDDDAGVADDATPSSTGAPQDTGDTDTDTDTEDDPAEPAGESAGEPAADSGVEVNIAVVTIGDQRFEFDVTPGAIQRCDPNFFGAFWALGKAADNSGLELLLPPDGDPNFDESPKIKVSDETNDADWIADPDDIMAGVEPGESQVDSSTVEGSHVVGTATFVDRNESFAFQGGTGDEPVPVAGTFEVLCES